MFSNGKFKNTIAVSEEHDGLPLTTGNTLDRRFPLALMENGGGRHWVALEDRYGRYVHFHFFQTKRTQKRKVTLTQSTVNFETRHVSVRSSECTAFLEKDLMHPLDCEESRFSFSPSFHCQIVSFSFLFSFSSAVSK